jgi:hypothetical protein
MEYAKQSDVYPAYCLRNCNIHDKDRGCMADRTRKLFDREPGDCSYTVEEMQAKGPNVYKKYTRG